MTIFYDLEQGKICRRELMKSCEKRCPKNSKNIHNLRFQGKGKHAKDVASSDVRVFCAKVVDFFKI
jgi:hypothetical protein